MNYNTDGFNERSIFIHNSNDANRLKNHPMANVDNSFAKMRLEEHKADVTTTNNEKIYIEEQVKGNRENFIIRNNNIRNANAKPSMNNPVSQAINRNLFKKN